MARPPPGDLGDDARPRLEDILAFRITGDRIVKLHVATWHAGPHFVHDECRFLNLENLDTNRTSKTSTPTGAIFTPCPFPPNAATGSE